MRNTWILIAITGHLLNAVAFIIDKILLGATFKRSGTYAALIGMTSLLTLVALPWAQEWPPLRLFPALIGFGSLFVFGLWAFFEALRTQEASRVVPVVGSLVPIFTLIGARVVFQESLPAIAYVGFCLLIAATWLLTGGGMSARARQGRRVGMMIAAGASFAVASLCGKYVLEQGDFVSLFLSSRVVSGLTGLAIVLAVPSVRDELSRLFFSKPVGDTPRSFTTLALTLVGQSSGAIGFVLLHVALLSGSASLVNALQAIQYAVIVLVAWTGGARLRKLLAEKRTPRIVMLKGAAILLIALGLACIAPAV